MLSRLASGIHDNYRVPDRYREKGYNILILLYERYTLLFLSRVSTFAKLKILIELARI